MQELQQSIVENSNLTNIKEVANGVVHPIIKEKITRYKNIISDPRHQDDWIKRMCKELGRLSQEYKEKGADDYVQVSITVVFVDLDKIKTILEDQVVTYVQIVVDS